MRSVTALFVLALATSGAAQDAVRPPRLRLQPQAAAPRQAQPKPGACHTTPEVYWLHVEGSAERLARGQHLVLLVNPMLWDGRRLGWFAQCQVPQFVSGSTFRAIGQVGSEGVPGGGWFAGQRAAVVVVATTQRPTPGALFADPAHVPGFVAASDVHTLHLTSPNSFPVTADCDSKVVTMAPLGVPALGNGGFGMDVGSPREGRDVFVFLGVPTYGEQTLPGGACALHLGSDPLLGAIGTIRGGHLQVHVPVPNSPALRGRMFALQSVLYDDATAIGWSSAAWLVTPW